MTDNDTFDTLRKLDDLLNQIKGEVLKSFYRPKYVVASRETLDREMNAVRAAYAHLRASQTSREMLDLVFEPDYESFNIKMKIGLLRKADHIELDFTALLDAEP